MNNLSLQCNPNCCRRVPHCSVFRYFEIFKNHAETVQPRFAPIESTSWRKISIQISYRNRTEPTQNPHRSTQFLCPRRLCYT